MGERLTINDLLAPNDLLLHYDGLPEEERFEWLNDRIGDLNLAYAFDTCARDENFRSLVELQWNGNLPSESFVRMEEEGFLYLEPDAYISHVPSVAGTRFPDFDIDWHEALRLEPRLRLGIPPAAVLRGAVCGYAARMSGNGIVMRRDLLEASLEVIDWDLLKIAKDPDPTMDYDVVENVSRNAPLWRSRPAGDLEATRRKGQKWWNAVPGHGTVIHQVRPTHQGMLPRRSEEEEEALYKSPASRARNRKTEVDYMVPPR